MNLGPRQDQYFLLTAEPPPLQGHKIISLLNKVKDKELENLKKKRNIRKEIIIITIPGRRNTNIKSITRVRELDTIMKG